MSDVNNEETGGSACPPPGSAPSHRSRARPQARPDDGLDALLASLEGPADHWDRPEGDWGVPEPDAGAAEQRRHANSCYRLGSTALRRGELRPAGRWLGQAQRHGHPGAAFRLAVVVHRRSVGTGRDEVVELLARAARWGHADARRLLTDPASMARSSPTAWQDPEFATELRTVLRPAGPVRQAVDASPHLSGGPHQDPVQAPLWSSAAPRWSPLALRAPSLGASPGEPSRGAAGGSREKAHRALRVLEAISRHSGGVSRSQLARETSLPHRVLGEVLGMLCRQRLAIWLTDGAYTAGPALRALGSGDRAASERTLRRTLLALRDAVGAAVYVSRYEAGEVRISHFADGPGTPCVLEWVDFRAAAHASAVGKCLLSQLDPDGRRDHVSRHRTARFTSRTITDEKVLFTRLDSQPPSVPVLDLQEYAEGTVCAAVPVNLGAEVTCVALSLPYTQAHRLAEACRILSGQAATVLLSLLLVGEAGRGASSGTSQGHGATTTTEGGSAAEPILTGDFLRHHRAYLPMPPGHRPDTTPRGYWAEGAASPHGYVLDCAGAPSADAGTLVLPRRAGDLLTPGAPTDRLPTGWPPSPHWRGDPALRCAQAATGAA